MRQGNMKKKNVKRGRPTGSKNKANIKVDKVIELNESDLTGTSLAIRMFDLGNKVNDVISNVNKIVNVLERYDNQNFKMVMDINSSFESLKNKLSEVEKLVVKPNETKEPEETNLFDEN